jgi:hypothetical protein
MRFCDWLALITTASSRFSNGIRYRLNVKHAVDKLKTEFNQHPEIQDVDVCGAVYDIRSGGVEWM